MKRSEVYDIFMCINSMDYKEEEKWEAVCRIVNMETHNSITKDAMLNVMRWMISQVEGGSKTDEWIPCTTKYPPTADDGYEELSEPVLVTYLSYYKKKPTVSHAAVYSKTNNEWYWEDTDDRVKVDIVAWMPLPKPYNPKEAEK